MYRLKEVRWKKIRPARSHAGHAGRGAKIMKGKEDMNHDRQDPCKEAV